MHRAPTFHFDGQNSPAFDAQGSPVAPDCRALAECIGVELRKRLPSVTDVPQANFSSWAFRTEFEHALFHQVLIPAANVHLVIEYERYWLDSLLMRRPGDRFERYLLLLADVLQAIPNVSDVQPLHVTRKSTVYGWGWSSAPEARGAQESE